LRNKCQYCWRENVQEDHVASAFGSDDRPLAPNPLPLALLDRLMTRLLTGCGTHFSTPHTRETITAAKTALAAKNYAMAAELLLSAGNSVDVQDRQRTEYLTHLVEGLAVHNNGNSRLGAFMCGEAAELTYAASAQSDANWTLAAAVAHALQAELEGAAGELEQSVKSAKKAASYFTRGYKLDTAHRDFSWGLASSYAQLGELQLRCGDFEGAYDAALADVRLRIRNHQAEPDQADGALEAATAYARLATVAGFHGPSAADAEIAVRGVKYAIKTLNLSKGTVFGTRKLVAVLNVPNWVLSDREQLTAILAFTTQVEKILTSLVRQFPQQQALHRDLAETCAIVGEMHAMLGDTAAALASFKSATATHDRLLRQLSPGDAAQGELLQASLDCFRLATLQQAAGENDDATASALRGRDFAERAAMAVGLSK
jgi:tetratricopeptide (TPR) repeat protein